MRRTFADLFVGCRAACAPWQRLYDSNYISLPAEYKRNSPFCERAAVQSNALTTASVTHSKGVEVYAQIYIHRHEMAVL
jgi:hypothetical protein